ncbi:MAG TPA: peptide deformylase [Acidimicrobiales bacterium]|nr:peptide deformylase [Acidimicrobiales bacterium]
MALFEIRTFGDPVLRQRATEITTLDASLAQLAADMIDTMYDAPGVGLAAPQVGVQRRMFVYDINDDNGPHTVINPVLMGHEGEQTSEEGCLSVPGLSWPLTRYEKVHLTGVDLDGKELSIDAEGLLARCFQHEVDHLDGMLLLERLDRRDRKGAMKELRGRTLGFSDPAGDSRAPSVGQGT